MLSLKILVEKLIQKIENERNHLLEFSKKNTGNSIFDTEIDLNSSLAFLKNFSLNQIPQNTKPKGKILVILSINEPLLLSIVPIFCAIAMGNEVYVRPSSKNLDLFKKIWIDIIDNSIRMDILDIKTDNIEDYIKNMSAVYFFGSYKNAKSVYEICAKHFVAFFPEIEAADCKIFKFNSPNKDEITYDIDVTIRGSYTHNGMMCQRIGGLFIDEKNYEQYRNILIKKQTNDGFAPTVFENMSDLIEKDIFVSKPKLVLKKNNEYIVFEPEMSSDFVKNAYFAKVLWVNSFKDTNNLIQTLNERRFFLGLNIATDDKDFKHKIMSNTNFSRYTLNNKHCDISKDIGWGGNWPSGCGGYQNWYNIFSNRFIVIN